MSTKGKILIADDEAAFLKYISDLLTREGYECRCVNDGQAAAKVLGQEMFDVFICDLIMPGNEDLALIRNLPGLARTLPVILLTGQPSLDTAIESLNLSVMAYLVKPVAKKELLGWVERLVEYSRVCRSGNEVYDRLSSWTGEIDRIREHLVASPRHAHHLPVGNFISLTIGNMLGSLLDLKGLVEGMTGQQGQKEVCKLYDCPRLAQYRRVIEETIKVLEKTRQSFKSKELSDLRKKLEQFVTSDNEN